MTVDAPKTDPEPAPKPEAPKDTGKPTDSPKHDAPADESLREPGLKALRAERDRADKLEAELKPMRDMFDRMRGVFGDEKKPGQSTEDMVTGLQAQIDSMKHDSLVNQVARRHGITDDADVALLASTKDADVMARLADRLKGTEKPDPPKPDPDPGQGKSGSAASDDAAYEQFYPSR